MAGVSQIDARPERTRRRPKIRSTEMKIIVKIIVGAAIITIVGFVLFSVWQWF
jgi:hypothetical protein